MKSFDESWLAKLEELRAAGVDPYPNGLVVTHTSKQVREKWGEIETGATAEDGAGVAVGGRVMFRNRMGRAMFLRIADRDGPIQIYLRRDEVGDEIFALCKGLDIGDFLWARGTVMKTRTGELSVQASEARLASKILSSFPDRWHGVVDVETRSRQRYVDLFMN